MVVAMSRRIAVELYEEIISLQPNATRAYASLAALYPDNPTMRREIYLRGIAANPKEVALNLLLSSEYERAGETEDALKIYENLLADNANNMIAANNLAALLLDHRSDPDSYARALKLAKPFENTDQAAFLDTLGWAYYRNEDFGNAVRLLEASVAADDKIGLLHYHLGMALVKLGMPKRGRDELEESLRLAKDEFTGIDEARATLEQLKL